MLDKTPFKGMVHAGMAHRNAHSAFHISRIPFPLPCPLSIVMQSSTSYVIISTSVFLLASFNIRSTSPSQIYSFEEQQLTDYQQSSARKPACSRPTTSGTVCGSFSSMKPRARMGFVTHLALLVMLLFIDARTATSAPAPAPLPLPTPTGGSRPTPESEWTPRLPPPPPTSGGPRVEVYGHPNRSGMLNLWYIEYVNAYWRLDSRVTQQWKIDIEYKKCVRTPCFSR